MLPEVHNKTRLLLQKVHSGAIKTGGRNNPVTEALCRPQNLKRGVKITLIYIYIYIYIYIHIQCLKSEQVPLSNGNVFLLIDFKTGNHKIL